jgi:hypothetical protein
MKKMNISSGIAMAIGTAAFAMMTGQAINAQSQAPGSAASQSSRTAASQQVTLTGCIQREADYRRSTGAGRGGVAATGVGTGNEFVLANAMMSPAGSSPAPTSGAGATPSATGTAGTTSAYELTGTREGDAAAFVGKRVEITGMMKAADTTAGGPTANVPGSQDLQLRELEISSIKETTGTCSAPTAR